MVFSCFFSPFFFSLSSTSSFLQGHKFLSSLSCVNLRKCPDWLFFWQTLSLSHIGGERERDFYYWPFTNDVTKMSLSLPMWEDKREFLARLSLHLDWSVLRIYVFEPSIFKLSEASHQNLLLQRSFLPVEEQILKLHKTSSFKIFFSFCVFLLIGSFVFGYVFEKTLTKNRLELLAIFVAGSTLEEKK